MIRLSCRQRSAACRTSSRFTQRWRSDRITALHLRPHRGRHGAVRASSRQRFGRGHIAATAALAIRSAPRLTPEHWRQTDTLEVRVCPGDIAGAGFAELHARGRRLSRLWPHDQHLLSGARPRYSALLWMRANARLGCGHIPAWKI